MPTVRTYMAEASDWLLSISNDDGGWGLHELAASRLINTCEAMIALSCSGVSASKYDNSIKYLTDVVLGKHQLKAQYQRHFGWVGYALIISGEDEGNLAVRACVEELLKL